MPPVVLKNCAPELAAILLVSFRNSTALVFLLMTEKRSVYNQCLKKIKIRTSIYRPISILSIMGSKEEGKEYLEKYKSI